MSNPNLAAEQIAAMMEYADKKATAIMTKSHEHAACLTLIAFISKSTSREERLPVLMSLGIVAGVPLFEECYATYMETLKHLVDMSKNSPDDIMTELFRKMKQSPDASQKT